LSKFIPYGRQSIGEDDIRAVAEVLKRDLITTGPAVGAFEEAVAGFVDAGYGAAVSCGTAALHAAVYACGIEAGDEVIVPSMTFAATANAVVFQGATPVFCDVDGSTLLLASDIVEQKISQKTKAIIAVDYAGQPCDYDALREIADRNGLVLIADACHSLGAAYKGRKVGTLADLTVFSFHPVKHITTGEGGMVVTDNPEYSRRMKMFRNHGITLDHRQRTEEGSWFYEMVDLGYNYRITDFQCALGMSQLKKLPGWIKRRQEIASRYDQAFDGFGPVERLALASNVSHAYHLYVIKLRGVERDKVFGSLRAAGIGVNVHYIPVHLHPFYRKRFGTKKGMCPVAETAYERILSLPMFPAMTDEDVDMVVSATREAVKV
jgi:perosamine synthetase